MEVQLRDQTVLTRDNLISTLNNLESKINDLTNIIQAKLQKPDDQLDQLFNFKSKKIQYSINIIFRVGSLTSTLAFLFLILGIFTIIEVVQISFQNLQIIAWFFIIITIIWLSLIIMVTVEQIACLINRTAKIKTMAFLYFSLVLLFALVYTETELAVPNSFNGININHYSGSLRTIQSYFDFLYFSSVSQSSVGFGDINPSSAVARVFVFGQTLISVAYLSILFSNWIS